MPSVSTTPPSNGVTKDTGATGLVILSLHSPQLILIGVESAHGVRILPYAYCGGIAAIYSSPANGCSVSSFSAAQGPKINEAALAVAKTTSAKPATTKDPQWLWRSAGYLLSMVWRRKQRGPPVPPTIHAWLLIVAVNLRISYLGP